MISTLSAAGAAARNALPPSTVPAGNAVLSGNTVLSGSAALSGNAVPSGSVASGAEPAGAGTLSTGAAGGAFPLPSRVPGAALSLLRTARQGLAEAESEADPATRYISAHLAALRAAAAIVAARGEPGTAARRRRPRSVWELLPQVEPALAEWAAFFAAGAAKRAAAEAGLPRAASAREADDLLRDASTFVAVAEQALGLAGEPMLPLSLRHAS